MKEFAELAKSKDVETRANVAKDPKCPPSIRFQLCKDKNSDVCYSAIMRITSVKKLRELMNHKFLCARCAIVRNTHTTPQMLDEMAVENKWNKSVLHFIIDSPKVKLTTLCKIYAEYSDGFDGRHQVEIHTAKRIAQMQCKRLKIKAIYD